MKSFVKAKYIILAIVTLVILGVAGTYRFLKYYNEQQIESSNTANLLLKQQQALKDAQQQIDSIKAEDAKNSAQSDQTKQKINILEQDLKNSQSVQSSSNTQNSLSEADIISQWTPNIALIACDFSVTDDSMKQLLTSYGIDTQPYTSIGSGFVKTTGLKGTNSQNIIPLTIVATNRHVFWGYNGSVKANSCKVFLSGNHTYFISPNYILDPNSSINDLHREVINGQPYVVPKIDAGYFLISNPDSYIQQIADNGNNVCNAQPKIGDSVIILGYPAIGSANSITATDGIISGIESNYYVTSAKVEHGNSGGAAILKDKNCYVGIPSYAETGDIESLARILDFNLIFK